MIKKYMPSIALLVLLAGSLACQVSINGFSSSPRGSGNVIQEERPISGVTSVEVRNDGDLFVEIGEPERLVIEAEDNLLPYIETRVNSGRLEIGTQRGVALNNREPLRYYLTVKSLEGLAVSSSGDITAPQLSAEDFSIDISSSGEIVLDGLNASTLDVDISSSGDVIIDSGMVDEQDIHISSSGNYDGSNLQSRDARVDISSSGDARINVSDQLRVELSSSGNVYYSGDPDVDARQTSSGDVIKED